MAKKSKKDKLKQLNKTAAQIVDTGSTLPMVGQCLDNIEHQTLATFSNNALRTYGSYVVEERAIPDYRDGLKPSHRAILWSLCGLSLRPSSGFKKAARTVGEAIGKYHPHGDASVYGAMVTMANTVPPIVSGQGNWGTPADGAAAMRYTEAKMSKFASTFMADSKYLEVVPTLMNFSNDEKIPLYMPALLPFLLFNGSTPPPAYGVRAGNPSFSFDSVVRVVHALLSGKEVTAKKLAKTLNIKHEWGCDHNTEDAAYLDFITTGRGGLEYGPQVGTDYKNRLIQIKTFCPQTLSSDANIGKTLERLSQLDGVKLAYNAQGKKSKGAGPYGALFNVETQKSIGESSFEDLADKVYDIISSKVSYRLGVSIRKTDEKNGFKYMDYVSYLRAWTKYRIGLELRMIKHLIQINERELHLNEVYLFAIKNLDKLLKLLPKVLVAKDPDQALSKAMGIPVEDAKIILDRKIRQLAKLEEKELADKIKALKDELKKLRADQKEPGQRAALDLKERVARYRKNPDVCLSGLTIFD